MKKKLFSCAAVLLLLCVVLSAGILCRKKTIRAISFLEVAGPCPIPENVEYHLSPETMETIFGHRRKIYTFVSYRKMGYDKNLLKVFEMEEAKKKPGILDEAAAAYTTEDKELVIHKDGTFSFSFTRLASPDALTASLGELEARAEADLKSRGLFPEGFYPDGYSKTVTSGDGKSTVTRMGSTFRRNLDGFKVYGSSYIHVEYDSQGLLSIDSMYSGYKFDRIVPTISFEEACAIVKTRRASISYEAEVTETPDKVVIDEAELIYFDTRTYNGGGTHVLPCYAFDGLAYVGEETTKFSAMVMAVPERMMTR
jgi:hypothetical protein